MYTGGSTPGPSLPIVEARNVTQEKGMAAYEDERSEQTNESVTDSELEQYGVWVKVGPEDVSDDEPSADDFALSDLAEDELEPAENEFTLDDPTDVTLSVSESDESDAVDALSVPDDELLSLDDTDVDFDLPEETEELGTEQIEELDEPEPIDAEPVDRDSDLLSLDELGDLDGSEDTEESNGSMPDLESIDSELDALQLDPSDDESASIVSDDDLPASLDDIKLDPESLDVDSFEQTSGEPQVAPEFGTLDELSPEPTHQENDESGELKDELEDLGDLESLSAEEPDELSLEVDDLDLSILDDEDEEPEELSLEEPSEVSSEVSTDDEETEILELDLSSLPDDDDDEMDFPALDTDEGTESLPELEIDDGVSMSLDEGFDDVSAVEDQMFDTEPPASDTGTQDRLASIQQEIHELRQQMSEISALREEFRAVQRQLAAGTPAAAASNQVLDTLDEHDSSGGFFEDDEDEKFQLTEDELDNIMNTAEFTEEAGEPTNAEEYGIIDEFAESPANSPADDLPTNGPVQEITLDDGPEDLAALEIDIEDSQAELTLEEEDTPIADVDVESEIADIPPLEDRSDADFSTDRDPQAAEAAEEDAVFEAEPIDGESGRRESTPMTAMAGAAGGTIVPDNLKEDLRSVIAYMDTLLDSLPEEKVREFANSDHFETYRSLFVELGLGVQ